MSEITISRFAAFEAINRCRQWNSWSQQSLMAVRSKYGLNARDSSFCNYLCLSVLQNASLCDFYISCYAKGRLHPQVRDILRLGICQILFMEKVPLSAAVSQSVELCKRISPKAAGLVNGVLHRICENMESLPQPGPAGTSEELSVRYSHPLWLCSRLVQEKGYDFASSFLKENNRISPLNISINRLKTDKQSFLELLGRNNIAYSEHPKSEDTVLIESKGEITNLPGFSDGLFFVQDAAANLAVQSIDLWPNMKILDACAAPGGKSFAAASILKNNVDIISCDIHEKKLSLIEEGAERLGFSCIHSHRMDASRPDESYNSAFDAVIADVPCSGFGVIRKKPEIRYKSVEEIENLPSKQLSIIESLSHCLKPGGELLYSTCTIISDENEGVVRAFLEHNKNFRILQEKTFWPNVDQTDGFYFCLLEKDD